MRFVNYAYVARRIAAANNDEERAEAAVLASLYYRYGPMESTVVRMAALHDALIADERSGHWQGPR